MSDPRHDHPSEDELLELALGRVTDSRSSELRHVNGCLSCRATYDELAGVLDATLPASPAIAPPAGFESRVLSGLHAAPATRPTARRRLALLVAASVAAGLIVGATTATLLQQDDPAAPVADPGEHRLRTTDGASVGSVLRTSYEGHDVLVVVVDGGPPGQRYSCRLRLPSGLTVPAGTWTVPPSGRAVWVAQVPAATGRFEMVATPADRVWATAELDG